MNHKAAMHRAIEAAHHAQNDGGVAIGAVLVDDATRKIIAEGGSVVGVAHDPTAHAEINCIRLAAKKLDRDDLFGHTLYSTLEPCQMCLSAAAWAKIAHVYFGAYRKEVDPNLFETDNIQDEVEATHMNLREPTGMEVHGGILEAECAALLSGYHESPKHSAQK